jgi:glycosyltransferase involved in cell wall biosynthesis
MEITLAAVGLKQYTILHTIESGGPGGAETVLLQLVINLDKRRFRSLVLLIRDGWLLDQLSQQSAQTVLVKTKAWYDFGLPRAMSQLIRREKVDLIHSHLADQNFYSCIAARLTARKVIATYHGTPGLFTGSRVRRAIKSWTVRHSADAIVGVSDYMLPMLVQAGLPADKMVRIYNGVDLDYFSQGAGADLRTELGLPREATLIGMVANLRRPKGYEYFVRAARLISDRVPETKFIAVGEKDKVIAGELKDLIHQLGLEDKFFFLGFRSDIPAILKGLDVFVLSSTDEGLSIATIEAMAAGRPVVVTRSGGPEEIVQDGKTGFLVPPANAEALAARVCDVLVDPQLASRLGEAAREDVRKRFGLSNMIREYESLYLRCLGVQ